jgi:deoxycytidylate deaminase
VLGIGYNDVPKAGGGLYTSGAEDKRCYQMGDCRCINDTNKQERFEALQAEICAAFTVPNADELKRIIWKSQFKESTEYCRAVHAEMEALISLTRNPGHSGVGATMYVTTYPCHNCTKHILDAGIAKVVYIEPYPKSLAEELHGDAITFDASEDENCPGKLLFIPYRGVAPDRYEDFFTMKEERKSDDGKMIRKTKAEAVDRPLFAKELLRRSRGKTSTDPRTIAEMQEVNTYTAFMKERSKKEDKEGHDEPGGKG